MRGLIVLFLLLVVILAPCATAQAAAPTKDSVSFWGQAGPLDLADGAAHVDRLGVTAGPRGEDPAGSIDFELYLDYMGSSRWIYQNGPITCLNVNGNEARMTAGIFEFQVIDGNSADQFRVFAGDGDAPASSCREPLPTSTPLEQRVSPPGNLVVVDAPGDYPIVQKVTPMADATDVNPAKSIVAVFDAPMDQAATKDALSLATASGAAVPGTTSWYGPRALIFTPSRTLDPGATYRATVSKAGRRQDGTPLVNAKSWSFKTTLAPVVTAFVPRDGATNVALDQPVVVGFNKPMDKPSTATGFHLTGNGSAAPIAGQISWYGNALIFVPSRPLAPNAPYRVVFDSSTAKDVSGLPVDDPIVLTFTTGSGEARPTTTLTPPGSTGGVPQPKSDELERTQKGLAKHLAD